MKGRRLAVLVAAGAVAVAACTTGGSPAPSAVDITIQLQWFPQAQFAGYYAALDKGYYSEEGLNVTLKPGAVEIVPAVVVEAGTAQFGVSWVPRMLAPREAGADGVVIAQVFQRSPTTQISFVDKGIETVDDFEGKKIGSWGFGNEYELFAGMRKAGIDPDDPAQVTIVQQQFDMNAFLAGDIDAAQAMTYNEYAQVLEAVNPDTGELYQPADLNVISWEEYGTSMLQDALFSSERWLAQAGNEDIAVKVIKASYRGWAFCRDNIDECVQIVLKYDAQLPKTHQTWQLNEVNALIWPAPNGIGIMDQAAFDRTVQIAIDSKVLTKAPTGQAWRNDLAEKAISELGADFDSKGLDFEKTDVTLTEGGK